jgi:hypothetical protein
MDRELQQPIDSEFSADEALVSSYRKTFHEAPWFLKALLLFLPFVLSGKIISYAISLHTAASYGPSTSSFIWLAANALVIAFVATVTWFAWRPRPLSRWLVAAFMMFAIARTVYQWFFPSGSAPFLSTSTEGGDELSLGSLTADGCLLGWAYLCVFSKRALAFYRGNLA